MADTRVYRILGMVSQVALVAVAGCGGPHIKVPAEYDEGMDLLTADGRDDFTEDGAEEEYQLGPYRIHGVQRNLSGLKGFDMFEGFEPDKKGGYRYSLSGGGAHKLTGKCAIRSAQADKELDGSLTTQEQASLGCTCEAKNKSVAHVFVEDLAGEYGGPLVVGNQQARATGVYRLDNDDKVKGRPAGYIIEDTEGAVAAADVLPGEGHVWVKQGIEEPSRRRLVCAIAGLMLWPTKPQAAD